MYEIIQVAVQARWLRATTPFFMRPLRGYHLSQILQLRTIRAKIPGTLVASYVSTLNHSWKSLLWVTPVKGEEWRQLHRYTTVQGTEMITTSSLWGSTIRVSCNNKDFSSLRTPPTCRGQAKVLLVCKRKHAIGQIQLQQILVPRKSHSNKEVYNIQLLLCLFGLIL